MKLKEQFEQYAKEEIWRTRNYNAEECELIADDFAIGFAEWLSMFTQEFEDGDLRYWNKDRWERKSIKELLEIYKKEKGL
jgi:hypothetical protein